MVQDRGLTIVCNFRAHKPVNHCPTGLWAGNLHKTFQELTAGYTLDVNEGYRQLLKLQTITTNLHRKVPRNVTDWNSRYKEIDKRIRQLRDRLAMEETDREMYEEYKAKFPEERHAFSVK